MRSREESQKPKGVRLVIPFPLLRFSIVFYIFQKPAYQAVCASLCHLLQINVRKCLFKKSALGKHAEANKESQEARKWSRGSLFNRRIDTLPYLFLLACGNLLTEACRGWERIFLQGKRIGKAFSAGWRNVFIWNTPNAYYTPCLYIPKAKVKGKLRKACLAVPLCWLCFYYKACFPHILFYR